MFFRTWMCLKSLQAVRTDSLNQFASSECSQKKKHDERASRCTTRVRKGSLTIEAALAFPLFLFAMTALLSLFFLLQLQTEVGRALTDAGREQAQEAYLTEKEQELMASVLSAGIARQKLEDYLEGRVAVKLIKGGLNGIRFLGSRWDAQTSELTLKVTYQVSVLPGFSEIHTIPVFQQKKVRGWTGYQGRHVHSSEDEEEWVYKTTYGTVYHRRLDCRHLKLSIQQAKREELEGLRNSDGAKYYPCEHCMADPGDWVYITEDGNRYHAKLNCQSLIRGIYRIRISETGGLPACSACGG